MSIIKNRSPQFVTIPSPTVRDGDLTGDELGLLVFLLDFPPDWDVSIQWIVRQKRFGSNTKVCAAMKRFRELGYARLTKHRDGSSTWDITSLRGCFASPAIEPNSQIRNLVISPDSENRNQAQLSQIPVLGNSQNPNYGFGNASTEGFPTNSEKTTEGEKPFASVLPDGQPTDGAKAEKKAKEPKADIDTKPTWDAYLAAYEKRYGVAPLRNMKVNAQMKNFVRAVGLEAAPLIVEFYLAQDERYLIEQRHSVGALLVRAESLHTSHAIWRAGLEQPKAPATSHGTPGLSQQTRGNYASNHGKPPNPDRYKPDFSGDVVCDF